MKELLEKYNSLTPGEMFKFNTMVDITFHSCSLEGAKLTKKEVFLTLLETLLDEENDNSDSK
jgi:hypothetical protein